MQAVKAIVKNGRLVVDEPTDLPEGAVVELVSLDEALADSARRKKIADELAEEAQKLGLGY